MRYLKESKRLRVILIIQAVIVFFMIVNTLSKPCIVNIYPNDFVINDAAATVDTFAVEPMLLTSDNMIVYKESELPQENQSCLLISGEGETYERCIAESISFSLLPGMYEMEVQYYSLLAGGEFAAGAENATGMITLYSENNISRIRCNPIVLRDGICLNTARVWVQSLKGLEDLSVKLNYNGSGTLAVYRITFHEMTVWRVTKCLFTILLFAIIDWLYYIFSRKERNGKKYEAAALLGTIFFISLPLFTDFLFMGHDLDFHMARIYTLACEIESGNWLAPIQTEMVNGYGYATPLFYSQLYLYFPAFLYLMGVPIQEAYKAYVLVINILTVLGSNYCFSQISKNRKISLTATFLYSASAYRITNIYTRGAVGEYTAMTFFPLIICGFYHIYTSEKCERKHYFEVAIGLSGLLYCHVLSCEMILIFLLIFVIWQWKKTFSKIIFERLIKAASLTVLLSLAFLVTFLDSYSMNLHVKKVNISSIQYHGAYLLQILNPFFDSQGQSYEAINGDMPLSLGLAPIIGILLYLGCRIQQKDEMSETKTRALGKICTTFSILAMILALRAFPWDYIEEISPIAAKFLWMVQFPWRYLVLATVFSVFVTLCALILVEKQKILNIMHPILLMVMINILSISWYYMDYAEKNDYKYVYGGADVVLDVSAGEYILEGTVRSNLLQRNVLADFSQVAVVGYDANHGKAGFYCVNASNEEQLVQLPLMNYANYHAYLENVEIAILNGTDNRLSVMIPGNYQGRVEIQYEIPTMWKLSYVISFVTAIGMIISGTLSKKYAQHKNNDTE